jgi:hypothetical protein
MASISLGDVTTYVGGMSSRLYRLLARPPAIKASPIEKVIPPRISVHGHVPSVQVEMGDGRLERFIIDTGFRGVSGLPSRASIRFEDGHTFTGDVHSDRDVARVIGASRGSRFVESFRVFTFFLSGRLILGNTPPLEDFCKNRDIESVPVSYATDEWKVENAYIVGVGEQEWPVVFRTGDPGGILLPSFLFEMYIVSVQIKARFKLRPDRDGRYFVEAKIVERLPELHIRFGSKIDGRPKILIPKSEYVEVLGDRAEIRIRVIDNRDQNGGLNPLVLGGWFLRAVRAIQFIQTGEIKYCI